MCLYEHLLWSTAGLYTGPNLIWTLHRWYMFSAIQNSCMLTTYNYKEPLSIAQINQDLEAVRVWSVEICLTVNLHKSQAIAISSIRVKGLGFNINNLNVMWKKLRKLRGISEFLPLSTNGSDMFMGSNGIIAAVNFFQRIWTKLSRIR